jgi:hypothetical protein
MRKVILVLIIGIAAELILTFAAFGQGYDVPRGWKKCPECQSAAERKEAEKYKPEGI